MHRPLPLWPPKRNFWKNALCLSVVSPLLNDNGANFGNGNVLGRTDVTFFPVNNPLYSGNQRPGIECRPGRRGDRREPGLAAPHGDAPKSDRHQQRQRRGEHQFVQPDLDELRIDGSQFTGNGRAGLVINLNNVQINKITIVNSNFSGNANDGLCILGNNSMVENAHHRQLGPGRQQPSPTMRTATGPCCSSKIPAWERHLRRQQPVKWKRFQRDPCGPQNTNATNLDLDQNTADRNTEQQRPLQYRWTATWAATSPTTPSRIRKPATA